MQFLLWIIVGLAGGWMTGKNMQGYGYGPLMDMVMGILGALAGGFIVRSAYLSGWERTTYTMLGAILGAVVLTVVSGLACGRKWYANLELAPQQDGRVSRR
ncbi:MAG: GlsB/YeaQ/YmgE family stress response membrane protein [Candidatus Acidiferrales bacterium]